VLVKTRTNEGCELQMKGTCMKELRDVVISSSSFVTRHSSFSRVAMAELISEPQNEVVGNWSCRMRCSRRN
jgi:hypothetical protein